MKQVRKPLGNKARFDVFKRDLFRCQYCGKTPPSAILEVDHIHPVSKGGGNEIDNLLTACFECNRGKSKNELTAIPDHTASKVELLIEKEKQYIEFQKIQLKIEKRICDELHKIGETFKEYTTDGCELSPQFLNGSVRNFLKLLGFHCVNDAMTTACNKNGLSSQETTKYFCGICWNEIKNEN